MATDHISIGMVGAGRASELHLNALKRFSEFPVHLRHIVAPRAEQVNAMKERFGFEKASSDFQDLLRDPEIDVIDICTPPYVHEEMIEAALAAGKHVICEKPLTGYFGLPGDAEPIGEKVSKAVMFRHVVERMERLQRIVEQSDRQFMYAENFIYAPAILKAAEIIRAKKSRILFAKGEESLKGSSSPVAGEWNRTGGGTFIRTGSHPLSAILWLKQQEAQALGKSIRVKSVLADMTRLTPSLSEYEHRHIAARPHDVEDIGTVILAFSDGSRAVVMANDTLLGGSKNYVQLYCNDTAINCRLTMADMMETYFLDEEGLDEVEISEMLPQKTGWNKPFLLDDVMRGYTDEMKDFMECALYNRHPKSDFHVAAETVRIIYAAYQSAEQGRVVEL